MTAPATVMRVDVTGHGYPVVAHPVYPPPRSGLEPAWKTWNDAGITVCNHTLHAFQFRGGERAYVSECCEHGVIVVHCSDHTSDDEVRLMAALVAQGVIDG